MKKQTNLAGRNEPIRKVTHGTVSSQNEATTVKLNRKGSVDSRVSSKKGGIQKLQDEKTRRIGEGNYGNYRRCSVHELPRAMAGRYRFIKSIGKGAFGEVFMAEDMLIGRIVAIKELLKDFITDPRMRELFMQEARIAGRLGHLNIVSVLNVEKYDNIPYIIMEYLGGGNLDQLLNKEEKPFDICHALDIMSGILSGLDAAHNMLIVHSDIKPSNIIFGVGGYPKLADFGISKISSKAMKELNSGVKESFSSTVCGTPAYMSPEQSGGQDYDCRSDIYSAGAVLYKMLSGKLLFETEPDRSNLEDLVSNARPMPLSTFRKDVPGYVEDLMLNMLEPNPNKRCQSSHTALTDTLNARGKIRNNDKYCGDFLFNPACHIVTSPTAILTDIISLLLVDGEITTAERIELARRAQRLGIGESMMRSIEIRIRIERKLPIENVPGSE